MALLTQRALRVFSVLEDYRAGSKDILDALMPFFEPLLAGIRGTILDQHAFANSVHASYRWNFTADIVEELIPRFLARKWVAEEGKSGDRSFYRVIYDNPSASPIGEEEIKIGQVLSAVADLFVEFIRSLSPLTAFSRTTDELSDILVEWLISIDAYTEDVLRHQAIQTIRHENRISLAVDLEPTTDLSSEDRYLCARFVRHLFDTKSPYIQDLCKIASVGLLTEVIQDFHKPVTRVNKTDLMVYLDAPVALDLLGVSGTAATENIRPLVLKLQEIGATIRIFRVSIEELSQALDAVLKRPPPERTGPTADAIRRNQTSEAYVRQVATTPEEVLKSYNIHVVDRKLELYPNQHQYFSGAQYDELASRMHWHLEMRPREHDAAVITQIMRMRTGTYSVDLFQTKHVLITRNGTLAQMARRFCVDNDLLPTKAVGPAIHQRQLATAIWLRTGLGGEESEVPRRYVLAACERVLELKKNIVDQVRIVARNLTPEKAGQLELLLTQDRSVQVLMDKTLGVSQVISSNNIDALVDVMKQEMIADVTYEKAAEIAGIKKETTEKIKKERAAKRVAEEKAIALQEALDNENRESQRTLSVIAESINRTIPRMRRVTNVIIFFVCIFIGMAPLLSEVMPLYAKIGILMASGIIGAIFAKYQILDRPMHIVSRIEGRAMEKYLARVREAGLERKAEKYPALIRLGKIEIGQKDEIVSGERPASLL